MRLIFLYRDVLNRHVGEVGKIVRAKQPSRLPVVLSRQEVRGLLDQMNGVEWLVGAVLYGSGLRVAEAVSLRVKDLDFQKRLITVRRGKPNKDRITMLPERVVTPLTAHLRRVKKRHDRDLADGYGAVPLPTALARKYPSASTSWPWHLCSRAAFGLQIGRQGRSADTTSRPPPYRRLSSVPSTLQVSASMLDATRSGTALPRTFSKKATTYGPCRSS